METTNISNVFEKGVLVQIKTSVWTGKIKASTAAVNKTDADADFLSIHKSLVSKECLKPIENIRNLARGWVANRSLPFTVTGVLFIPKDMIEDVDQMLSVYQNQFYDKVDCFVDDYETYTRQAKDKLGELYNPTDYPKDIRRKFSFEWNFFVMAAPDKMSILSPAIYEREKENFQATMNEFEETAMQAMRSTFSGMMSRISERLSGEKKKTFKDTTITNIRQFIKDFKSMNITDDKELEMLVARADECLGTKVTPEDLRTNDSLRLSLAGKMSFIDHQVSELVSEDEK
ncbi:hypothetical protein KAR91_59365 [Candidatus Pacearchaeota archaeon]|nr:hypothetical protein [Candidatus Pacearchaeota archaeon]